ncbi:hypothetical protein BBJ28_00012824 [Nothophytophthora sp. Chile5]|nr:hypothetical protein BBJ28_00012824 [Nothophytophthora sp. Chile5]
MAEDEGKASTPEPGEAAAAPRPRLNAEPEQQPTEAIARGSPMATSSGGATPSSAQNAQQQQWRGSPPRGRFGRPYNNGAGRGYFKRHGSQQMLHGGFDGGGGAPFQHERVFSRSRGRSVSRSPSRASQQARSRSRSPRSPRSPRSRSRSRSFSPRGHRTFANWERGGRGGGGGQYAPGRGGRGGGFDGRQRGRDRDAWARGGGRGGGRYQGFQRASRFVPKDSRYKKGGPMLGNRRSASRDRGSNDGSMPVTGSFRDRQMREREQREREREHRGRTRDRGAGNRSTSLARTASFSSDYFRDSELSASAEEGEEKPDEIPTPSSEKSAGTQTPSEASSVDHGSARTADSDVKLNAVSSARALPPLPGAGGNRLSTSKDLHQPGDDGNIPMDNKLGSSDAKAERSLDVGPAAQQSEFTAPPTEAMEVEEGVDKETGELDISQLAPPVDAANTLGENQEARSADTLDEHVVAADNAQQVENAEPTSMGSGEMASETFSATRTQEIVDCASRTASSEEQVAGAPMETSASSEVVTVQEVGMTAAHASGADDSERRPEEGQEATSSTTSAPVQVAKQSSEDMEISVGEESANISERMGDAVEDLTQSDGASLAKNVTMSSPGAKEGHATTAVQQEQGCGDKTASSSSPAPVPSEDVEMEAASGSLGELLDDQQSTSVEHPVDAATMDVEMKGPESNGGDDAGQLAVASEANSTTSSPTAKQVIAGPKQATGEPDSAQTNTVLTASTEDGDNTAVLGDAEVEEGEMVAPSDDADAEMEVDDATVVSSTAVVDEVTSSDHSLGSNNESAEAAKPKAAPELEEKREKTAPNKDRGKPQSTSFSSPGLPNQETDKPIVKTDTAAAESSNAETEVDAVEAGSTQTAQSVSGGGTEASASKEEKRPIKLETSDPEARAMGDDTGTGERISEEKVAAMGTPEKETQQEIRGVTDEAAAKVENAADEELKSLAMEDGAHDDAESENVSPVKPSKEEILSTIDTLDSNISDVKKQIKALQRTIADAEVKRDMSATPEALKMASALDPAASTEVSKGEDDSMAAEATVEDPPASPATTAQFAAGRHLLSSPVKVAVDSRFVELVAGVFSENLRKTASANDQLPKRMEQGGVATKIYRQPSDYPFYQANIARGLALSDQVRLKVRKRNRLRHDYMKKLARDYVDLKKVWKLRVKKMEKDRKRQDKMRSKQQQKNKQKLKNAELAELNSAGGPVRTTNTSHQSPHVQQLLAAEKAAEAAGGANGDGAGATVRTSSRLTNNSSADLQLKNDLEKIEQTKAQALIDQEIRKKRLKNALTTVIPDMLITPAEREARYFTRFVNGQSCMADGLVTDWKEKETAEMKVNPWNDLEKCIYMDKFLQFPKNFPRISSFLSNKTTGDVIAFYYRTKKVTDYKALLREQQLRRRGAGSKNTWSCWNLSACAAISLGVQFPQHVARLLLHPTNFRSHQASDNILNSAGAQRLLRDRNVKLEDNASTSGSGTANGLSALSLVSGSDHTPCVRSATSETGVQLDGIANSGDEDTTDGEKFNLYAQQLGQFVAGQQQPFLVDYASLLSDNSYSTGYEVSTLSVAERLKRYPPPSNEIESASAMSGTMRNGGSGRAISGETPQESIATKVKQQSSATGGSGGGANAKNGGSHMTKKELKQQRKLKKLQEGAAAAAAAVASASAATSSQLPGTGNAGGEKSGNHSRKKSAGSAASSNAGAASGNRSTPRVSIPGEEKAAQGGKKGGRSGAGTPGSRRNIHHPQGAVGTASPKISAVVASATAAVGPSSAVTAGAMKAGSGNAAPFGSAGVAAGGHHTSAMTPSATGGIGGGSAASAPAKRVVQKWTEAEKADFLKFFSLYGKDWTTLTESIPTKTAAQIKNYYQNYKNRLNLQDILKRRIENAAAGGSGVNMPSTAAATAARGGASVSPRTAAAGLMNTSLRQSMGGSVGLSSGLSAPMSGSSSMAMSGSDANISFQAALNAVQPGLQPVGMRSELSASPLDMQMHQDQQQQQSREMAIPVSNSERYLKLLNMQHQLQIMQLQQHQKSQAMASEAAGAGSNNSPYHDGQLNAANAQRLMQFSRHPAGQQQQQLPPQMSLEALQQMGLQPHLQASPHSHMMQLPMQQQQARGSYAEMAHPSSLYHSMTQMQAQHSHAMAATSVTAQMGMSPTSTHRYDGMVDPNVSSLEGSVGRGGANPSSPSNLMAHRDISQRAMLNLAMMNNTAGSGGGAALQPLATNSPRQPAMGPPRRSSVPTGHSRMGLMSNLLNVPSPERRASNQGRQSPLMQQQQQVQQQMQAARYYDVGTSGADGGQPSSSRASIATMASLPASLA